MIIFTRLIVVNLPAKRISHLDILSILAHPAISAIVYSWSIPFVLQHAHI